MIPALLLKNVSREDTIAHRFNTLKIRKKAKAAKPRIASVSMLATEDGDVFITIPEVSETIKIAIL
jgi:hypothetical protein